MVDSFYGSGLSARNGIAATSRAPLPRTLLNAPLVSSDTTDVSHVLLAAVDASDDATLDSLARTIPDHPEPISAILALVDRGWLDLDLASPFDATCRVWRAITPQF